MEFNENLDNLSLIIENPSTHPSLKEKFEQLRKISWQKHQLFVNRTMQLVSYSNQIVIKIFDLLKESNFEYKKVGGLRSLASNFNLARWGFLVVLVIGAGRRRARLLVI